MGFYTYIGDELDEYFPKNKNLKGEFDGKFAGGYELYHWCFHNNIKQLKIGYEKNSYYDESELVFELTYSDIEKAMKEQAMGENNSKTVLKRLLNEMKMYDVDIVYFYGSF